MIDWTQYSTSALYSIQANLEAEIQRRTEHGDIPTEFKCNVCHREIEGDSYEFDENAKACNVCYESDYKNIQQDVRDWEAWQRKIAEKKGLFHLECIPVSEGSYQTCYCVFMKEVDSNAELVRSADKGELMGKYQDRYEALNKIDELAKPYGEFTIFE